MEPWIMFMLGMVAAVILDAIAFVAIRSNYTIYISKNKEEEDD